MKLIVGLGNYDEKYKNTRHNIGFMFVDYVFGQNNFVVNKKMKALEYKTNIGNEAVMVIKPLTYMNLSGDAVLAYVNYYKISLSDIFVVQDDMDLELAKYKLMYNHGNGGHNGIKDITLKLNSKEYLRLKIGIGKSDVNDTKDYVLGKFSSSQLDNLNVSFNKLRNIFDDFCNKSFDYLMQKYNSKIQGD